MILNVSGRTDIVAFYTEWFMNRYREGYVDVRNPFYPKQVSRIRFENVDLILFCTKNPIPILKYLKEIQKPILFHVTLTPYKQDIEPNVPPKGKILEAIKTLSKEVGIDNLTIRYDPIFLSEKYSVAYHKKAFANLCTLLEGYVNKIIVSFLDDYQNVRRNYDALQFRQWQEEDYAEIGQSFSESAKQHGMTVQTCFEERNLHEYGFQVGECLSHELAYRLTGKTYPNWKARNCHCVELVDIGVYNSCKHFCKYCYANYDENKVKENISKHHSHSSLLVGELEEEDMIKERKK